MNDDMIGSLLLDHAGLSAQENLMVVTATGNNTSFDNIKDVLILQHGRIHIRQKGNDSGKGSLAWTNKYGHSKSRGKGKVKFAHNAACSWTGPDEEEHYPEEQSPYGYYSSGYTQEYCWDDSAWDDDWYEDDYGTAYHSHTPSCGDEYYVSPVSGNGAGG
eukprot:7605996-Pyramimonas_sp.AAC.1